MSERDARYTRIKELEKEIVQLKLLEKEIVRLKAEECEDGNLVLSPEKQLAIDLHGTLCYENHAYGCKWYIEDYRENVWEEGSEHHHWLRKANVILASGISLEHTKKFLLVIRTSM